MPEYSQNVSSPPQTSRNISSYPFTQATFGDGAWYAAHVRPKHEFTVVERLSALGIEHYLPLYRSLRQWSDRKVWLSQPLFPGYLFVRIRWAEKLRVLMLPGVLSVLGTEDSKVDDDTIASIRHAIELKLVEPCLHPEPGDRVKMLAGPFEGIEGTLLRKDGDTRVVIYLKAIAQPFTVHTTLDNLQKI